MNQRPINMGVDCKVSNCYFHTAENKCTAEKIEVSDCSANCCCSEDTFCKTYKEK